MPRYALVIALRIARGATCLVAACSGRARRLGLAPHAVLRTLRIEVERFDPRFREAHGITKVRTCKNLRLAVQELAAKPLKSVPTLYQIRIYWHFLVRGAGRLYRRGRARRRQRGFPDFGADRTARSRTCRRHMITRSTRGGQTRRTDE
jgi:hypothetical protein